MVYCYFVTLKGKTSLPKRKTAQKTLFLYPPYRGKKVVYDDIFSLCFIHWVNIREIEGGYTRFPHPAFFYTCAREAHSSPKYFFVYFFVAFIRMSGIICE